MALVMLLVLCVTATAGCGRVRYPLTQGAGFEFSAYYTNDLNADANGVMRQHADVIRTIYPLWYEMTASGSVLDLGYDSDAAAQAKAAGVAIVPAVRNGTGTGQDPAAVLRSEQAVEQTVSGLVALARSRDYLGINLSFDSLPTNVRAAYSNLVLRLANRLQQYGKKLVVTVPAKPDRQSGDTEAYDYRALARSADFIVLSAYDYHSPLTGPGPLAPLDWVRRSIIALLKVCPRSQVLLAVGAFGYDWPSSGTGPIRYVSASGAEETAVTMGVPVRFDESAREGTFTYSLSGTDRVVWFNEARGIAERIRLARLYRLYGVAYWRLGQEGSGFWTAVPAALE